MFKTIRRFLGLETRADSPAQSIADPNHWALQDDAHVTPYEAMKTGAVWQAVSMISGDLARLPIDVYQYTDAQGNRKRNPDHAWADAVKANPYAMMTAFRVWRQLWLWVLLFGRAYCVIDRAGRRLIPAAPWDVHQREIESTGETVFVVTSGGVSQAFTAASIIELTWLEWDSNDWPSPIQAAQQSITAFLSSQKHTAAYYKNGAFPSAVVEVPPVTAKEDRDKLYQGLISAFTGAERAFKLMMLKDGAKFHQMSHSASDMQQTELKESEVREIARFYNLAPSRLGLSDSVSYNSKAEDNKSYHDSTLAPFLAMTEQELNLKLLSAAARRGSFFEVNTNALLRADIQTRFSVYDIGYRIGVYSPADIARIENLSPNEKRSEAYNQPNAAAPAPQVEPNADNPQPAPRVNGAPNQPPGRIPANN